MHPNHISRLFQEHAGCSFTEFLNKLRLPRAAELLQDPQLSVKEVIYASGFSNDVQFYRGFRARFGLSPRKYREQSIEKHYVETGT